MIRLRKILLSEVFYLIIFFLSLINFFLFLKGRKLVSTTSVSGTVVKISDYSFVVRDKEYSLIKGKAHFPLGSKVLVKGKNIKLNPKKYSLTSSQYQKLVNKNYKHYLKMESVQVEKPANLIYRIKNRLLKTKSSYTKALTLGVNEIDDEMKLVYQKLGISHIFALSGTHLGFIAYFLEKVLKKIKEEKKFLIISVFLFLFYLLTQTISILRAFFFYLIIRGNTVFYFHIEKKYLLLLILSLILLIKPWYLLNVGFIYSFFIASCLYLKSNDLNLFKISFYAFLASFPISVYFFHEINLFSVINNIILVPFVSLIIFPLSFVNLFFSLEFFERLIFSFERMALFLNKFSVVLPFRKLNFSCYILYCLSLILFFKRKEKRVILIFLFLIAIHLFLNNTKSSFVAGIDVGQGDSFLIRHNNVNILIDTGEEYNYLNLKKFLRSEGIRKIDYLILSHGDKDHLGSAHLIEKDFQVKNTFVNLNQLTKEEKKLNFTKFHDFNLKGISVRNLNHHVSSNENDSSLVLEIIINNKKIIFLGDISKKMSDRINYPKADIVKISHHGSKYSNSLKMIEETDPEIFLIGVGENSIYNHPHQEVLKELYNKIYLTSILGTFKVYI